MVELALEADLLRERRHPAFEAEERHRDPPTLAHLADDEIGAGARAVEEHLVELSPAGDLHDRPDLHTGLFHRHEQEREPRVASRRRVRARDHEAPVGHVCQRRPDLLAREHPLVTVERGAGLHRGEIRAGVGLAVALAPSLLTPQDRRKEPVLLFGRPELDEGRCQQVLAHVVHARRRLGTRVLLGPDDLLGKGRAPAAVLDRPPEADEAGAPELPFPADPGVEPEVLVAGAAASAQRGVVAGDVLRQPPRDVVTELLVVVGDLNVGHRGRQASGAGSGGGAGGAPRMSSIRTPSGSIRNTMSVPRLARVPSSTSAPCSSMRSAAASTLST